MKNIRESLENAEEFCWKTIKVGSLIAAGVCGFTLGDAEVRENNLIENAKTAEVITDESIKELENIQAQRIAAFFTLPAFVGLTYLGKKKEEKCQERI